MVGSDVDGVPGRHVAACDHTSAQYGLDIQAARDGDGLENALLGRWRGEKRKASEEAEVNAADGIDGATARRRPEHRRKDEAAGEALLREPFRLDRASRRDEVKGAQWEERGDEAKATSAGRGAPACAQGGAVMFAVVPGNDAWTRLAGAVEDVDLLFGQEAGRECGLWQPFCLDRP